MIQQIPAILYISIFLIDCELLGAETIILLFLFKKPSFYFQVIIWDLADTQKMLPCE